MALPVSLLHSAAMTVAALAVAWLAYRRLDLRVLRSAWLDLNKVWG